MFIFITIFNQRILDAPNAVLEVVHKLLLRIYLEGISLLVLGQHIKFASALLFSITMTLFALTTV